MNMPAPANRSFTTIVSPEQLNALLPSVSEGATVIFDTRFALNDTSYGMRAFADGHIPGSHYLHLDQDLSSPITSSTGRHPLPSIEHFQNVMRKHGVSDDTQVIVYDDAGGMFASRCWWLLKWLSHESVAVLDGGMPAWIQHAGAIDVSATPLPQAGSFVARARTELVMEVEDVQQALANGSITLCDARAPERYRGDVEPIDKVGGHVPGAVNVPFAQNLNAEGRFKTPEELRSLHAESLRGNVVHMCGSGVTACHNILAYAVAGLPMPRLYPGSWSHWITDPGRPIARG